MRKLLIGLVVLVALGVGTTLAMATGGGGWHNGGGSGHVQYDKPGCGPDKTDGVAGKSGRHVGQPPKDQNRGDCPNPPGHNDGEKKSYDKQSYGKKYDDKKGSGRGR